MAVSVQVEAEAEAPGRHARNTPVIPLSGRYLGSRARLGQERSGPAQGFLLLGAQ